MLSDLVVLFLAGSATALVTGLGAVPVFLLGERARRLRPAMWGTAIGLMSAASVVGLLLPAVDEGGSLSVAAGSATGVAFLALARWGLRSPELEFHDLRGAGVRTSLLVFGVLLVHSLPEGMAIGTAYASGTAGLGLFVILAIALQNIPEGCCPSRSRSPPERCSRWSRWRWCPPRSPGGRGEAPPSARWWGPL